LRVTVAEARGEEVSDFLMRPTITIDLAVVQQGAAEDCDRSAVLRATARIGSAPGTRVHQAPVVVVAAVIGSDDAKS